MPRPDSSGQELGKFQSIVQQVHKEKECHRKEAGSDETKTQNSGITNAPSERQAPSLEETLIKRPCPWMLKAPVLRDYGPKIAAEFVGTFIFVHTICFSINNQKGKLTAMPPLVIGSALMVLVYTFGPISGGHFNPAVTIANCLIGEMDVITSALYIVTQFNGALISSYLAIWVAHILKVGELAAKKPNFGWFPKYELDAEDHDSALYLELFWTFVLVTVFLNVMLAPEKNQFYGLAIGFTYFIAASSVEKYGSFNPVVCFGVNLGYYFHAPFHDLMPKTIDWIEIMIANLIGGVLAGLIWRYIWGVRVQLFNKTEDTCD